MKYEFRIADNPLTRDPSIVYSIPLDDLCWVAIARIHAQSSECIEFICEIEFCCLIGILYISTEIIDIDISSSFEWGDDFFATEITDGIARSKFRYEFLENLSRDEYFPV